MKVRTKTLLMIASVTIVLFIAVGWVSSTILMSGFKRLEQQEAEESINMVSKFLEQEQTKLDNDTDSAAATRGIYEYMAGKNPGYIDEYFSDDHFRHFEHDFVILTDNQGSIRYKKFFDYGKDKESQFPAALLEPVQNKLISSVRSGGVTTYMLLDNTPAIVSIHPISGEGRALPNEGFLVSAWLIKGSRLRNIGSVVGVPVGMNTFNESGSRGFEDAKVALKRGDAYFTQTVSDQTLLIYKPVTDLSGNVILIVNAEITRDITEQGRTVIWYVMIVLAVASIVFTIAILTSLSIGLLRKIRQGRSMIKAIEDDPDESLRLPVVGSDELSLMAVSLNNMLDSLQKARIEATDNWRLYETMADVTHNMVVLFDDTDKRVYLNQAAVRAFGQASPPGTSPFSDKQAAVDAQRRAKVLKSGNPMHIEEKRRFLDAEKWVDTWLVPIKNDKGETIKVLVTSKDITEQMRERQEAAEALEFYQRLFDGFPNPVWRTDAKGSFIYVNKAGLAFTGHALDELIGKGWMDSLHEKDKKRIVKEFKRALASRTAFQWEYRLRRFDGEYRWVLDRGQPFYGKDGKFAGFLGSIIDITDKKLKADELAYLATHDALTGMENRRVFENALKRAIAKARRGANNVLMFVDLDGLKEINDTYGHLEGDKALIAVAGFIREEMRTSDVYTRLGGDEFAIILEDADEDEAGNTAGRLCECVEKNIKLPSGTTTTVSVGLAVILPEDSPKDALSKADIALYRAKTRGRNKVVIFIPGMEREISDSFLSTF